MSTHIDIGKKGEEIAKSFLEKQGYHIQATNWRYSKAEIDIIAFEGDLLVFVEVKTRSSDFFGPPEDFVDDKKKKLLSLAAAAYMAKTNHQWSIRFDIISILLAGEKVYKVQHFKDAFFPGLHIS